MSNDFFATIRTYLTKVSDGDKSATEVAAALNQWMRDSGEALKVKIEDEVERSVSKMGFVKRGEFEALKEEVARLKSASTKRPEGAKKTPAKSEAAAKKRSTVKKSQSATSTKATVKKTTAKRVSK
ncbi:unannotated protein [freshwater metagenome]|uniref:Unannotated protein n=1 Tax=freshwater metagenome TaxID=449393 RepID=A0A6J7IJB0_9ZZZZ